MGRALLLFFMLMIGGLRLHGQKTGEVGAFLGMINYQGDLAPTPFAAGETNFATGVVFRQMFTPKWGLKVNGLYGNITADDRNYSSKEGRGLKMEASILEFSGNLEFHPMGAARYTNSGFFRRQFSPYISVGAGLAIANPELTTTTNFKLQAEEDNSTFLVVPVSVGIRFSLSPGLTMTLDVGSRPTFSDGLDGVSANGSSDANDWYMLGGLTVLYTFNAERGRFDF